MVRTRRSMKSDVEEVVVQPKNPEKYVTTSNDEIDADSEFVFNGVSYDSYEKLVAAKRKRNKEMLQKFGLLGPSLGFREETSLLSSSSGKPTVIGLSADKKRRNLDRKVLPRRKSSRIAGIQSEDIHVEEERRGGKIILGGSSAGNNDIETKDTLHQFNDRVNDGSDLSIKDAVHMGASKWLKDNSAQLAEKFISKISKIQSVGFVSSPKSVAPSLSSQAENINVDHPSCVVKVVPERIYSVSFHPTTQKIIGVAGDKLGYLGFVDQEALGADDGRASVHLFKPHSKPISNLEWSASGDKLFSSSYDGTVRVFDVNKQAFIEVFGCYDDSKEFNNKVGYGIDLGYRFWTQYMTLDHRNDNCFFLSTSLGGLIHVDCRENGNITYNLTLSEKKINTISLHPNGHTVATAGLDGEVKLWDSRKFTNSSKKISPFATHRNGRSVNSAFFSPSGSKLLATTMSNTLDIISDPHLQNGIIPKPDIRIRHDNLTGRWLSTFMAQWHPTSLHEELFIVGSMAKPRRMEVFDGVNGNLVKCISGDSLTSVMSRCCFHPSSDRLIGLGGNSSGRLTMFT